MAGNKINSPISNSMAIQARNDFEFHIRNVRQGDRKNSYVGSVIGVSSPDEGFLGSSHDTERDFFKFRVLFEEEKITRWVIPYHDKEYYYERVGYCEESYMDIKVICEYPGNCMPESGIIRGITDIGDIKYDRRACQEYRLRNPEVDVNKEIYSTGANPLEDSMGFVGCGFSGLIDSAHSYILNKLYGE